MTCLQNMLGIAGLCVRVRACGGGSSISSVLRLVKLMWIPQHWWDMYHYIKLTVFN